MTQRITKRLNRRLASYTMYGQGLEDYFTQGHHVALSSMPGERL